MSKSRDENVQLKSGWEEDNHHEDLSPSIGDDKVRAEHEDEEEEEEVEFSDRSKKRRLEHEYEVNKICCPVCNSTFETPSGLSRHVQSKHKKVKVMIDPQRCPICNIELANLNQHMKRMHPDSVSSHICPIITCAMVLKSKQTYNQHRKSCISCPYCDYKESKPARLNNHILKKH